MSLRVRPKNLGRRWRPGLDLVNLGVLLLGAIVVRALWSNGALTGWLPSAWQPVLRWSVVGLLGVLFVLDVVAGLDDLLDGFRRGGQRRTEKPPDRGSGGAAA